MGLGGLSRPMRWRRDGEGGWTVALTRTFRRRQSLHAKGVPIRFLLLFPPSASTEDAGPTPSPPGTESGSSTASAVPPATEADLDLRWGLEAEPEPEPASSSPSRSLFG
jgi:hypothetical protein